MSDFIWGVTDTVEAANGGQDMEMCATQFFGPKLVEAVKEGKVPEAKINESALRIVRTLLAFEEAYDQGYDESVIGCEEHVQLALECAREGITLLKNENKLLPLSKAKSKKIVVIGKLADQGNIGDYGSSRVYPLYIVTPLQGIANAAPDTEVLYNGGSDLEHAKNLAKCADAVIFVVGYDHDDEGEYVSDDESSNYTESVGGDRKASLGLHADEIKMIQEIGPVNQNSIAVLVGGNMIMMEEWKDSVSAILMAYYAGMEGGTALAEILFGDVNPSGRLPYVVPYKESDLPQVDWDTESQWYDYYHGYVKLEKEEVEPYLPYGFGLSYTTFEIGDAQFSSDGRKVSASCIVKNTGDMTGIEVVQMYVGFKNSKIDRQVKLLRGFVRAEVNAGESKKVTIECPIEELCWFNPDTNQMEIEHMDYEVYIGTSSAKKDLLEGVIRL